MTAISFVTDMRLSSFPSTFLAKPFAAAADSRHGGKSDLSRAMHFPENCDISHLSRRPVSGMVGSKNCI